MANTFMETAQRIKNDAGTLLEKIGKNRQSAAELLTRAKLAENALVEKERARKKEQEEKEKEERLARFLQEGGNTYTTEQPAPVASVEAPKQAPNEAVPAAPAAEPAPAPAAKEEKPAEVKSAEPAQAEEKPAEPKPEARPVRNEQRTGDRPNDQRQQRTGDRPYEQRQPRTGDKPYEQRQPRTGDRPNDQRQQRTGDRPFDRGPRPGQNDNRPPRTGDRPNDRGPRPGAAAAPESMAVTKPGAAQNHRAVVISDGKTDPKKKFDTEKKAKNKKAIQKEAAPVKTDWDEEGPMGNRRKGPGKKQTIAAKPTPVVIDHAVITTETITVKDLSEKIGKPAAEIIKKLFMVGIMATINQEINFDACELIAADYGITLEQQIAKTFEDVLDDSATVEDTEDQLKPRPPVVTIMGHVDHGKTSLLDAFRHSSVAAGEAGGITQHIGAYTVTCNGRQITFIDTPGHEAFTSMRARGAQVTDVVILVVAADDGIMPQTIEAINHAKSAGVPIVVAINKIDRPNADPDRVQQQLTEYGLVSEDWGGDTIVVPVSAKQKINLDTLLEMVLLQADVLELKANPNRLAKGTIIEAKLDKNRGPVATVLVQNGTLKKGDTIIAGTAYGRIRAMIDDKGRSVNSAGPSMPVEILGFNEVPEAGDILNVADADKLTRQVAEERRDKIKAAQIAAKQRVSLDELFNQMAEGELKDLNIIVKADVQGSVEAIKQAFEKLSNEEVRVRVIHGAVGAITESDIMFASASNAIVIGFNVRPDASAKTVADKEKVDVRIYRVIYSAIEDIQAAMKGMFKPVFKEVELGRATVRSTFKISGVGTIAGAYINDGKVARNAQVRVVRDGVILYDGKIASLKRFKDDAKEVASGYECGISFENFNDLREGDVIEAYVMEQVEKE